MLLLGYFCGLLCCNYNVCVSCGSYDSGNLPSHYTVIISAVHLHLGNDNDNDNDNEISFILTQVNTSLLATLL